MRFGFCVRNRRGFTLIELVCAMAISSILVFVIYALFSQTILVSKHLESADTLFLDGSFAMDYIEREVKSAQEVYGPDEVDVFIEGATPMGFVLKIHEEKYVTYAQLTSTIRRYTAKGLHGFRGSPHRGVNLLSHHINAISSRLDKEAGILEVEIELEQGGHKSRFHRLLELPEQTE